MVPGLSSSPKRKACHKIGEQGFELGPDLTGSPSRDPAALLSNILDPNASVPPKDIQNVLVDQNGRTYWNRSRRRLRRA